MAKMHVVDKEERILLSANTVLGLDAVTRADSSSDETELSSESFYEKEHDNSDQ